MGTWADELEQLPTLCVSQACDLKADDGYTRVWLSRCGVEDGEPFARTVYVEQLRGAGWFDMGYYDGDQRGSSMLVGALLDGWNLTLQAREWESL